ncbi:MAG: hypothetical protein WBX26_07130 [Candidatus Cybelea sp.]
MAKKTKKRLSHRAGAPKVTRRFLDALTGTKEDTYRRVLDAIALSRRDRKTSPTKAARATGTTLQTMRRYAPGAVELHGSRYVVTPSDRLPRRMRMLTPEGEVIVRTTSSRTATGIADYNNAMRIYVMTGDPSALAAFKDKTVRSGGKVHAFATDRRTIDRFVRAGAVHFVEIYARGATA